MPQNLVLHKRRYRMWPVEQAKSWRSKRQGKFLASLRSPLGKRLCRPVFHTKIWVLWNAPLWLVWAVGWVPFKNCPTVQPYQRWGFCSPFSANEVVFFIPTQFMRLCSFICGITRSLTAFFNLCRNMITYSKGMLRMGAFTSNRKFTGLKNVWNRCINPKIRELLHESLNIWSAKSVYKQD